MKSSGHLAGNFTIEKTERKVKQVMKRIVPDAKFTFFLLIGGITMLMLYPAPPATGQLAERSSWQPDPVW